jgi:hypothetical protein
MLTLVAAALLSADAGEVAQCDQGLLLACAALEKDALAGAMGRGLAKVAWPHVDSPAGDLALHVLSDRMELLPDRPLTDVRAALERIHVFPVRVDLLIDAAVPYSHAAGAVKQVLDAGGKPRLALMDGTGAPRFFAPATAAAGAAPWTVAISNEALFVSEPGANAKSFDRRAGAELVELARALTRRKKGAPVIVLANGDTPWSRVVEVLGVVVAAPTKVPKQWAELQRAIEATSVHSDVEVALSQL